MHYSLLAGTASYQLADTQNSALNRAWLGILLCEDCRDQFDLADPQPGILHEYEGDFRHVAGAGSSDEAYAKALQYYATINEDRPFRHVQWQSEPEFELNNTFLFDLANGAGYEFEGRFKPDLVGEPLPYRIEFKRDHFGEIVDRVIEDGDWESETW